MHCCEESWRNKENYSKLWSFKTKINNFQHDCDFHNSLEHNLPDSPFASPTKSGGDPPSFTESAASTSSSSSSSSINNNNNNNNNITASSLLPATSNLDMPSFKSCFFQIPRFSSDHGAIGM